jgi:hypothetical protein
VPAKYHFGGSIFRWNIQWNKGVADFVSLLYRIGSRQEIGIKAKEMGWESHNKWAHLKNLDQN